MAQAQAEAAAQQEEIARLEEFVARFGAKASKASQAQSRMKQLEKLKKNAVEVRGGWRYMYEPCRCWMCVRGHCVQSLHGVLFETKQLEKLEKNAVEVRGFWLDDQKSAMCGTLEARGVWFSGY